MFYGLESTNEPLMAFISSDLSNILLNGIIWFKNLLYLCTFGATGAVWSEFFSEPTFTREFSGLFSLYSNLISTETYLVCQGLHMGSVCLLILVCAFIIQLFRFVYNMTNFIARGGMIEEEYSARETVKMGKNTNQ